MKKLTRPTTAILFSLLISGCVSTYYQRDLDIKDSSAGLVEFSAEIESASRVGVRASYSQLQLSKSDRLKSRTRLKSDTEVTDIAVVRHGGNYWESPATVKFDLKNSHLSLEGFYAPVDKDFFRLEIGGGFNHLNSDLSVGPNGGAKTGFSDTGIKIFTEASFKINSQVNFSIGLDTSYYSDRNNHDSTTEQLFKVGVNWLPVEMIKLSLGIFSTQLDGYRSDYDVNTGYVDPNSSLDNNCITYFNDKNAPSRSCLKEVDYFNNEISIKGQGIVGGITVRF